MPGKAKVAFEVLRAEGLRAGIDRLWDFLAEEARRRSFDESRRDLRVEPLSAPPPALRVDPSVLVYLSTPPKVSLGGLQASLRSWMNDARRHRDVALLFRDGKGRYRLEIESGGEGRCYELSTPRTERDVALRDRGFEVVVEWALAATGAELLHVVGLHGVPLGSLEAVRAGGSRLLISLHDFSPFCFRPHLLEHPGLTFCGYCRIPERCGDCLAEGHEATWNDLKLHREAAGALLARADGVTFPSEFLRREMLDLFPEIGGVRSWIVPPTSKVPHPVPQRTGAPGQLRRVAFVGSAKVHKGILVFEQLLRAVEGTELEGIRWSVLGGGDSSVLGRLRKISRVRVRGYFRAGSLPRLLVRRRVDLALLLSIVPESYGLTFGECAAAGVPVLAFDHGGLGERISREGGGLTVTLGRGAEGLVETLRELRRGSIAVPPARSDVAADGFRQETAWQEVYSVLLPGRVPKV